MKHQQTADKARLARKMRTQGHKLAEIGKHFGCSVSYVHSLLQLPVSFEPDINDLPPPMPPRARDEGRPDWTYPFNDLLREARICRAEIEAKLRPVTRDPWRPDWSYPGPALMAEVRAAREEMPAVREKMHAR